MFSIIKQPNRPQMYLMPTEFFNEISDKLSLKTNIIIQKLCTPHVVYIYKVRLPEAWKQFWPDALPNGISDILFTI